MEQFAIYTEKIIKALPYWFKMKKNPTESTGAKFLNIVGLEIVDVEYLLNYAYKQTKIDKADLDFIDIVYKTILPDSIDSSKITVVTSNDIPLLATDTLGKFFGINSRAFDYPELFGNHLYYLDQPRNILYVRHAYDKTNASPDGVIQIGIGDAFTSYPLTLHQVWNFFDEFGLLLDCPRIYAERNREYKVRILDVFKNPGGAHKQGLLNGIARELGLRKEIIWVDGSLDLVIEDPMIVLNSIAVDGVLYNESQVFISEHNTIIIPGSIESKDVTRSVTYVPGIEMHRLHNADDYKLRNELFNVDSSATDLLKYYVDRIHSEAPIMWDDFRWNESYWDISDQELGGLAFIPNLGDASIKGFTKFDKKKLTNYTKL